ncbi:DNA mismatch repair protein Mlh3 isoform X2 [Alligator sinensis]|uniref:DNA mismatch repair protein Mlh3 isoform X2 n=1 Tax=Alligator sinensis TaxID=38654 RepID=A0A3Q0GAU6_ALLSI|nr:DNA mismatch repair protein Mlh3 isoform X2 [Alligator sinensis]
MIKCLEEDVRARLRSGVAIKSLGQCVEELVLNSIDAEATCVAIRVDLDTFRIQVVDNGSGIGREDLNKVGNRYFTSKCSSVEDLENLKFYGFRGEALSSIANMASIVEISSKTNKTVKTFTKLFQNGKPMEVCEAELTRPSGGTTVTVCNLFYQLPVRKKCMDPVLEFERVRQKVEALALTHPSVSLSLRNDASCSMVLQLSKAKDICSRFCQIYGLSRSQKLREINHKCGGFELSGYISSEGHYNKNLQFLYVNNRLVLKTRLHKLIDFLLRKESVICKTKSSFAGKQMSSSPARHRCGPELYGIFVVNVQCQYCEYDVCLEPAKTLIEFRNWNGLLACVEEGVKAFLKREHLFIEPSSEDIKEFNENNDFCLYSATIKPMLIEETSMKDNFKKACDDIVDSYEIFNLQSKDIKRKATTGKKSSDPRYSNDRAEEMEVSSDLTIAEPANTFKSSKTKSPSFNKDDTTTEIPEQDPEEFNSLQMASGHKSLENFCGEARSEIIEIDNCDERPCCTENYVQVARSHHDKVALKSNTTIAFRNDVTQGQQKGIKVSTEIAEGPEILVGRASMGICATTKENRGTTTRTYTSGGQNVISSGLLKLCSTGLITHVIQNQSPPEQTEMNCSLSMPFRPGPVSAKDIFGNKTIYSLPSLNIRDVSSSLNKDNPILSKREVCRANAEERLENETVSNQRNKEVAFCIAGSRRDCVRSHTNELPLITSSGDVTNYRRQMVEQSAWSVPRAYKKLSLSTKAGSLERFRRHYGKPRSEPSISISEKRCEFGLPVELSTPIDLDTSKNQNNNTECFSICETPTVEHAHSNNSCQSGCFPSLERTQFCGTGFLLDRQTCERESPLTLTNYCQSRRKDKSNSRSPGSLASKLSRMKGDHEEVLAPEVGQLEKQSQTDLSRKDDTGKLVSQSESDNLLQSSYEMCQNSSQEAEVGGHGCLSLASDEMNIPQKMRCMRAGAMENTVNHSSDEAPCSGLALPGKKVWSEDACQDQSVLDVFSEQNLKATQLPSVTLPDSLAVSPDDTNMAKPVNEDSLSCASDWLQYFDVSLGKTVYINKTTGLSTYSTPPSEEVQAVCTKDITTMAVNVVLESGFQCRCYPFRSELVLPFLPRPREERILASQHSREADADSLQSLLSGWDNPIFACYPEVAVDVSSSQAGNLAVKVHNILYPYRFTKEMIHSMQVLQQVDNKFIACLINTRSEVNEYSDGNLLVLVDQHAAHERIRLEQLIAESYEKPSAVSGKKKLLSSIICPPLEIEVTEEQRRLLRCCYKSLEDLGLGLSFPENRNQILVGKVPLCFMEREANELRRKRQPVAKSIVEELIQEQIELLQTTGGARGTLPLTFLKVLASQACHGAIKFNDSLTMEESSQLIEALSCCQLPFQCAHGRPSMLPLADTDHLPQEKQPKPNLAKLRKMAQAWQLFGKQRHHHGTEL